jgi:hypothetical protein
MHVYNSVIYGKGVGSYCSPYHRLSWALQLESG